MKDQTAVVVLSGGQDSVTCLGLALKEYSKVYAIGFHYSQKHAIELEQAGKICEKFNVPFTLLSIPMLGELGDSALVATNNLENDDVCEKHHRNPNLPASFVPNRNALFLTTAHAYAQTVGAEVLITGVCETDYSGYPDCRNAFIVHLEETLNVGYETNIEIRTPLMYLDKAQTFMLAQEVGFLDTVINDSHTCYNGDRTQMHDWGAGCGKCPACELRAKGYEEFLALDEGAPVQL